MGLGHPSQKTRQSRNRLPSPSPSQTATSMDLPEHPLLNSYQGVMLHLHYCAVSILGRRRWNWICSSNGYIDCGFSLLCTVLTCHLRLFLLLNFLKHWLQSFGFSLGCTECLSIVLDFRGLACTSLLLRLWNFRTRFFKLPRRKKLAPHSLHTNSSGFESEVRLCFFCRCLFSPSFCLKFLPSHSVHSQKAWFQDGHSHGSAGPVQLKSFWNTNCIWTSSLCQSSCASLEPDQILTWTLPASSIWLSNSLQSVIFGGRLSTLTWFDRFWCWAILLPLQSLKKSDFSSYHHQHLPPTPHLEHLDFVTSKQTFHMLNPVDRCQKKVNFVLQLLTLQLIPN